MSEVVTWQSRPYSQINLTPEQEAMLRAAGKWPKDSRGNEFCQVSRGLHSGAPSYTNSEIAAMCKT